MDLKFGDIQETALIPLVNKERVTNASSETVGFKEMFAALKSNKPFMLVIISYFLGFGRQMAMGIQVQAEIGRAHV